MKNANIIGGNKPWLGAFLNWCRKQDASESNQASKIFETWVDTPLKPRVNPPKNPLFKSS